MDVATKRSFTAQLQDELIALAEKMRSVATNHGDPRARALCETSAEVLLGLQHAFRDFEEGTEPAWRSG